jgi:phthiocerol/phenolphthiocerol synthesis type-I polyketide synthase E
MPQDIAIIGIACRVPGASSPDELWALLQAGRSSISHFDADALDRAAAPEALRREPNYVPSAGVLSDIEYFDAEFFGIPAQEAAVLDPQHRVFLECVWEALEDAGCKLDGASRDIGVFAGASLNTYLIRNLACAPEFLSTPAGFMSLIGNDKDYLASRVAYKLDLHGPAITVQTACSTSLVAVHLAIQSLLLGECDVAVAGGVSVKVPQVGGYLCQDGMPFSRDGQCRPFDAAGTGTVFGSGAGVIVLKPLDAAQRDGDHVYAVVRGCACNNDGSRKVGFTAPSVDGQIDAIRRALALAEVDPGDVTYVEAHGTATPLGDPIEVTALQAVYEAGNGALPCALGSIKSNLGHLETAAGVVGLIKTALMLQHRQIVPSVGFVQPNPYIVFDGSRLKVQTEVQPWPVQAGKKRFAGVSAFGMGGTNVHLVLEEAPAPQTDELVSRPFAVLPLSARSPQALSELHKSMIDWLAHNPQADVHQLACHLQMRRNVLETRSAFVCADFADAFSVLTERPERILHGRVQSQGQPVAFLFCGGGAQYPGMAIDLYRWEPVFREAVDRCASEFQPLIGQDIVSFLEVPSADHATVAQRMQRPDVMFPALFAVQYAMSELLGSWGIRPELLVAHSNGEYAAAVLAGVMDVSTAVKLVAARSRLLSSMPAGGMLSVPLAVATLRPLVQKLGLSIGAQNAPELTALSGPLDRIREASTLIQQELGVEPGTIHVAAALHSSMTASIADAFAEVVATCRFEAPRLPWISSVTGAFMELGRPLDDTYWVRHLCQPVLFDAAAKTLLAQAERPLMIDIGPGRVIGDLLRQNAPGKVFPIVHMGRSHSEATLDSKCAYQALAKLWTLGVSVDWSAFQLGARPAKQCLPAYPWQRQLHWIEPPTSEGFPLAREPAWVTAKPAPAIGVRRDVSTPHVPASTPTEATMLTIWQSFFGAADIGVHDQFIELGGTSLLATQVLKNINAEFGVTLRLGTFLELGNVAAISREVDRLSNEEETRFLAEALRDLRRPKCSHQCE